VKGIPVVPVCHTGLRPVDLPIPLNMLQAIEGNDEKGWERIYALLAGKLGSSIPNAKFADMVETVRAFEFDYGVIRLVRGAVLPLIGLLPELDQIFRPNPVNRGAQGEIPDTLVNEMLPHLEILQSHRLIDYSAGSYKLRIGTNSGGGVLELKIQVRDSYYKIASDVMKSI
jgi:hypothetical protein